MYAGGRYTAMQQNDWNTNGQPLPSPEPKYGMKWHKFLIWFALWASLLMNFSTALQFWNGDTYGSADNARQVYERYAGLQTLDLAMGVVCIAIATFAIVTRFSLARFRAIGPKQLIALYVINGVVSLAYLGVFSAITGLPVTDLSGNMVWTTLIGSTIMVLANWKYYQRRAELFVN